MRMLDYSARGALWPQRGPLGPERTHEELRLKECPRDKMADRKSLDRRRSLCRHERLQEDADEDGYSSENDADETDVALLFVALGEEEHAHEEAGEED